MYANQATFDHFKMIRDRFHRMTHKDGLIYVRDKMVLRQTKMSCMSDVIIRREFVQLAKFHSDDVEAVFDVYLTRIETLMGNEVCRQYMELLKRSKDSSLEQLRVLKKKKRKRKREP